MSKHNREIAQAALDHPRRELAAAIEDFREAEAASEAAKAAVARADAMVAAAAARCDEATTALAVARAARASHIASSVASGTAPTADAAMRDARLREVEATDELDAARTALANLEVATAEATQRLDGYDGNGGARKRVAAAAGAVLAGAIEPTVTKIVELRVALDRELAVLDLLFWKSAKFPRTADDQRIKIIVEASGKVSATEAPIRAACIEARASWTAAFDALTRDADAPLPVEV